MYCRHCGEMLNENQEVCLKCGVPAGKGNSFCQNCGNAVAEEAVVCVKCGVFLKTSKANNFKANVDGIKRRSIAKAIVLSLVTCGIYSIYWFVRLTNDMNQASGREYDTKGVAAYLLSLITCGIYGCFWAYKMGEKRDIIANENASSNILYLVLYFFGLGLVTNCLLQDALNKAIEGNN